MTDDDSRSPRLRLLSWEIKLPVALVGCLLTRLRTLMVGKCIYCVHNNYQDLCRHLTSVKQNTPPNIQYELRTHFSRTWGSHSYGRFGPRLVIWQLKTSIKDGKAFLNDYSFLAFCQHICILLVWRTIDSINSYQEQVFTGYEVL